MWLVCIFSYLYTLKSCGSKAVHSNSFTVKDWWKLFAFDKIKINNKVSACQCGFLNCLKYLLNNLLMIFYFSNVERQRTFSFSEFFCYEFFHQRNRGRTQFWARPVKFANATVNFFSFFFSPLASREWTSPTIQPFFVVFSQDTPLFSIVQETAKPSNSDWIKIHPRQLNLFNFIWL